MGLEKLESEIIGEAKAKAEQIIKSAKEEAAKIQKSAEEEIAKAKSSTESQLDATKAEIMRKAISAAELEAKDRINVSRKEIMDELRISVLETLSRYPKDKKQKIYSALIEKIIAEISIGQIWCAANDAEIVKACAQALGSKPKIAPGRIIGGVIAENIDGTVSIDLSFETLVNEALEQKLSEASAALFSSVRVALHENQHEDMHDLHEDPHNIGDFQEETKDIGDGWG